MEQYDPSSAVQDLYIPGEFGGVNPSITDSSTFAFSKPSAMEELFEREVEGCFLYSRHWNPTNRNLADSLARMEGSEAAIVTASGMAAISCALLQLCRYGDEIVASRTIYGGTYALLKNFFANFGITSHFVDSTDLQAVEAKMNSRTKVLYIETISNPLLEVADIPGLAEIAHRHGAKLVVDNTFSPMVASPLRFGADVVVHSLTKYINGMNDCLGGVICGEKSLISSLADVNSGATMLLGPVLDPLRSASIRKNLHTLHLRMQQHGRNALFLAERLLESGVRIHYPGLTAHPHHHIARALFNHGFGFGGMLTIDCGYKANANTLMDAMQTSQIGLLAVSLGFYRTLFSAPGHSTSSEIPENERMAMGLGDGLVRISVGLDNDIETTWQRIRVCLANIGMA